MMRERRRSSRSTLRKPLPATVESTPVFILDVSAGGLRVVHRSQLPDPGTTCRINVPAQSETVDLDVVIVHTAMQHATEAADQLFSTGLMLRSNDPQSAKRLKAIAGAPKKR